MCAEPISVLRISARRDGGGMSGCPFSRTDDLLDALAIQAGYHEQAARRFMSTGAPMPEGCSSWKRYHAPGSVEGWIIVETDDAGVCYEHAAEWAEFLNWTVTPVFPDEQAGALISKVYS